MGLGLTGTSGSEIAGANAAEIAVINEIKGERILYKIEYMAFYRPLSVKQSHFNNNGMMV